MMIRHHGKTFCFLYSKNCHIKILLFQFYSNRKSVKRFCSILTLLYNLSLISGYEKSRCFYLHIFKYSILYFIFIGISRYYQDSIRKSSNLVVNLFRNPLNIPLFQDFFEINYIFNRKIFISFFFS